MSQKTWDTHVIVKMVNDKYVSVIQNSCVTNVKMVSDKYVSVIQKTWDTQVIVKMVRDRSVSVIQNSRVTKDMGYTCDCKDGE